MADVVGRGRRAPASGLRPPAEGAAIEIRKIEIADLIECIAKGRAGFQTRAAIRHVLRRHLCDRRPPHRLARVRARLFLSRLSVHHGFCAVRAVWRGGNIRDFAPARERRAAVLVGGARRGLEPDGEGARLARAGQPLHPDHLARRRVFVFLVFYGADIPSLPQLFARSLHHDLRADVPAGRQRDRGDHCARGLFDHRSVAAAGRRSRRRFRDRDDRPACARSWPIRGRCWPGRS